MSDLLPIPTRQQLRDRWNSEVKARFPKAKPELRFSFFGILGAAHAFLMYGLYVFVQNAWKNIFVSTAFGEALDIHGSEYDVPRKAATSASGNIVATGVNGSTIAAGTKLQAGSVQYQTLALGTISGGTATIAVQALTFGADTNQDPGAGLTFVTTPTGVDNAATVDGSGLTGGFDRETDEEYRQRILFRKRNPITGGSPTDYIQWTLEVPGVTRAYVFPKENGNGSVVVRFMTDNTTADGIPTAGDVTAVQTFLENERVGAQVNLTVEAPVAVPVAFDVTLLPNTSSVQENVEESLKDMLLREASPGKGIAQSKITQAVSNADGEEDSTVNTPSSGIPAGGAGDIPVFGSINFS